MDVPRVGEPDQRVYILVLLTEIVTKEPKHGQQQEVDEPEGSFNVVSLDVPFKDLVKTLHKNNGDQESCYLLAAEGMFFSEPGDVKHFSDTHEHGRLNESN